MAEFKDLTGKRFERYLVIKRVDTPLYVKNKRPYWLCKCDCGKEKIISGNSLVSGDTKSCGCYHKEIISIKFGEASKNKAYNNYLKNAENRNLIFELSKDDFFKITQENCFYCGKKPSNKHKNYSGNGDFVYNGIDRVNSNLGYTLDNIVPCCKKCNDAKKKETQSDFFEWIKTVHNNLINKGLI